MIILKPSLMSPHFNTANENQACPFIFYYTVIQKETIEFLMPQGPNEENRIKERENQVTVQDLRKGNPELSQ